MPFDPHLAAIRFGTGLSPLTAPPESVAAMLVALTGPDSAAQAHPIPGFAACLPSAGDYHLLIRDRRLAHDTPDEAALLERERAMQQAARLARVGHLHATLARAVITPDGLRERLTWFWADHFTVRSRIAATEHMVAPFAADAIRPHLTGRFADMLAAAITHPMMLLYLDQSRSTGPNSRAARQGRGLNENLAREVLELHSVGLGGPYDQGDVRELAELLTGLYWDPARGTIFRPEMAEPGAETVMGFTFPDAAALSTVTAALERLATHPATAAHIAGKLAVHFVADLPDPDLVAAMTARFLDTGGDLLAVTATLLDHPAAWVPERHKVKPPFDFIASALRALGTVPPVMDRASARQFFLRPFEVMGQPWQAPPGPDGWPESAGDWATPQGMAGRIDWAMTMPARLLPDLPDPRRLASTALGPLLPEQVAFAASAAEDRATGVGLVFASAAFQRR